MEIQLYNYSGNPQVIHKKPRLVKTITGDFRQPLSLMNPIIELAGNEVRDLIMNNASNYIQILEKYYYIMDWQVMPANIIAVNLHLDVLMTYRNTINNMDVMLDRSSSQYNKDIPDTQHPIASDKRVSIKDFPKGFSDKEEDGTYILVTSQNFYDDEVST